MAQVVWQGVSSALPPLPFFFFFLRGSFFPPASLKLNKVQGVCFFFVRITPFLTNCFLSGKMEINRYTNRTSTHRYSKHTRSHTYMHTLPFPVPTAEAQLSPGVTWHELFFWPGPRDSSQRKHQAVVLPLRDDVAQGVVVCS